MTSFFFQQSFHICPYQLSIKRKRHVFTYISIENHAVRQHTSDINRIFSFFSLEELVTSFFYLNSNINSIIQGFKSAIHTVNTNNNKSIDLLNKFSTQIGQLLIHSSANVNLMSLVNLRSLKIIYATPAQLNRIRPEYFPILEILHIHRGQCGKFRIDAIYNYFLIHSIFSVYNR